RLIVLVLLTVQLGDVVQARRDLGMIAAEGVLPDDERPPVIALGLIEFAAHPRQAGEVVPAHADVGMIRAEGFLPDRQRPLIERLGLVVLLLREVRLGEVVQSHRYSRMVWT